MRRRLSLVLVASSACLISNLASAAVPHRSLLQATTGNGYGFAVYDASLAKLTWLTENPFKELNATTETRNLVYDSYFGLRAEGQSAWLSETSLDPNDVGYDSESNVIVAQQSMGPLLARTHVFSPWGLAAPSVVLVLEVTNISNDPQPDAAAFALMNLHLGNGSPSPDATGEHVTYDATNDAFSETGNSGLTAHYVAIGASEHHGATTSAGNNPYDVVKAGGDLIDVSDSGVLTDTDASFEWSFANIAAGETRWVGVVITLGDVASAKSWVAGRTADVVTSDEVSAWESWRVAPPAGLSPDETAVFRQSESVLRMAQSRLPPPSGGQIVAALPQGQWWIAWVRDMSYAAVALAKMGHTAEASAAIGFMKNATVGSYESYVGAPYPVSVVRYFGDGTEESDSNADGPNIEFDGFGLAMWAAHATGSNALDSAATTLETLVDPTGVIKADSSIWEVHWDGQQKRFAYTSIAAARGLCDAGNATLAKSIRDAILSNDEFADGALSQSLEGVAAGTPVRDAAVIEAINFGLINPLGAVASETLTELQSLHVESGLGYFRNEDGGGYDEAEWVFLDLRIAAALRRMGRVDDAEALLSWITTQAHDNMDLVPELLDPQTADYEGSIPMVGFGAGAYVLTLLDRSAAIAADPCFPPEGPNVAAVKTPEVPKGGTNVGSLVAHANGTLDTPPVEAPQSSAGCATGGGESTTGAVSFAVMLGVAAIARGRRSTRRWTRRSTGGAR